MISKKTTTDCANVIRKWRKENKVSAEQISKLLEELSFVEGNRSFSLSMVALRLEFTGEILEEAGL